MTRRHDEREFLRIAVELVDDEGLDALTFGRVAARAGVPDRTIVYYFANKDGLISAVAGELGQRLMSELDRAVGPGRRPAAALVRRAFPVLIGESGASTFALWFDLVGRAREGNEPYRSLGTSMIDAWLEWVAQRVEARGPVAARADAAWVVATLDGALLLHHLGRTEEARRAIARAVR